MNLFKNIPIKKKLVVIIVISSISTFIIGISSYIFVDMMKIKEDLKTDALLNANLIGEYAIAPLIFGYPEEANKILAQLTHMPDILNATLTDEHDVVFAEYQKTPCTENCSLSPKIKQTRFIDGYLYIYKKIIKNNKTYGYLYMRDSKIIP
jgi:hypothetical protein